MPFAVDPNAVQKIVLDCDKDKDPQPAFFYRHLTYRKFVELDAMRTSIGKDDPSESYRKQFAALSDGLVGWQFICDPVTGQVIPFDAGMIPDIVTLSEAQEILMKRMTGAIPSVEDKKKLPSPSESVTADCVKDAKAQ